MEYVEDAPCGSLESEGRLLPQRALEITAQICAALDEAHRAGIVHRDVKPGNVMSLGREVKVMDFGIARAVAASASTMTQTAAVIGTANYLSPEQARGEHVDARSDVYSTGCLLYELLTGAPPFSGETAVAVAYQHAARILVPPSRIEPTCPRPSTAIVLKAMAKNPATVTRRRASCGQTSSARWPVVPSRRRRCSRTTPPNRAATSTTVLLASRNSARAGPSLHDPRHCDDPRVRHRGCRRTRTSHQQQWRRQRAQRGRPDA